jgi:hypothetical protein
VKATKCKQSEESKQLYRIENLVVGIKEEVEYLRSHLRKLGKEISVIGQRLNTLEMIDKAEREEEGKKQGGENFYDKMDRETEEQYGGLREYVICVEAKGGRFFYGGEINQRHRGPLLHWTEDLEQAEGWNANTEKGAAKRALKALLSDVRLRDCFGAGDYYDPELYLTERPYVGMGHNGNRELVHLKKPTKMPVKKTKRWK